MSTERKNGNGNGGDLGKPIETMQQVPIEVRFADLEKDAEAIANIWNQPKVIEHLAGVAPALTKRDITKFRANITQYIPLMPNITPEGLKDLARGIIMATPTEIKAHYAELRNVELYVAVLEGKVVGTATLVKPDAGKRWGTISKVAVSSEAPKVIESSKHGKGIARSLIRFIDNRMFNELGYTGAEVTVIQGVEGELGPKYLFMREGYSGANELVGVSLGWDNHEERFVPRNSYRMQRVQSLQNPDRV